MQRTFPTIQTWTIGDQIVKETGIPFAEFFQTVQNHNLLFINYTHRHRLRWNHKIFACFPTPSPKIMSQSIPPEYINCPEESQLVPHLVVPHVLPNTPNIQQINSRRQAASAISYQVYILALILASSQLNGLQQK